MSVASGAPEAERPRALRMPGRVTTVVALAAILVAASVVRFVGTDWDSGYHLHPDERFLTMVASAIEVPIDFMGYLDTDTSSLNPRNRGHNFFSYGTFPISLTRWIGEQVGMTSYGDVHLVGRRMSAAFDLVTVLLVFLLGARLYDRRVGLTAAALTAFTALHIQHAHFFTVDSAMVTFVTLTLFGLAGVVTRRRIVDVAIAGVGLGLALACKVAAWPLVVVTIVAIGYSELRRPDTPSPGGREPFAARLAAGPLRRPVLRAAALIAAIGLLSLGAFKLAAPDVFAGPTWPYVKAYPQRYIEVTSGTWHAPAWWRTAEMLMPDPLEKHLLPDPRWADSMERIKGQVTGFGMDWPPNHQWWGKKAYWFPWKNMVLWGMGAPLGIAVTLGWAAAALALARGDRRHLLPWLFATITFAFYGIQWAKSIRYVFPIYPAMIVLGAWGLVALADRIGVRGAGGREGRGSWLPSLGGVVAGRPGLVALAPLAIVVAGTALWGTMFTRIYTRDHSRVAAGEWIYHNLPTAFGARIAEGDIDDIRGPWLPAALAPSMQTDGFTFRFEGDGWIGPMRLQVPGGPEPELAPPEGFEAPPEPERPRVSVDAIRIGYVRDPSPDAGTETIDVIVGASAYPDASGEPEATIVRGSANLDVAGEEEHLLVPLDESTELEAGGEYYLWVRVDGAELECRPAVLAYETQWDDVVPMGTREYAAYDDGATSHAEGLFGMVVFNMYGEDSPAWLDETLDGLERIDYWVTTSNRVYDSVKPLPMRFPATIAFYDEALFGEGYGFEHIADITSFPGIGPIEVDDQSAEEAFHVYDHPRVNVFARTDEYDGAALRARLEPLNATRDWRFPPVAERRITRLADALLGRIPVDRAAAAPGSAPPDLQLEGSGVSEPADDIMLDPERARAQREGGTWREIFSLESPMNRWPAFGALVWYLALALIGACAFPIVALTLPNLADRGWSVARTAGLLAVSWMAWLAASLGVARHTPALVLACLAVMALASAAIWRAGRFDPRAWIRDHRGLVVRSELAFGALFGLFLFVRAMNPDLWHPWYGGEKPMDMAYLSAVVRSAFFPPYDPWFSGGRMNYYYFGFVVVGTLVELTRVVPWVAYNLALPSLAALTGHAAYGLAGNWLAAAGASPRAARAGGALAAILAVVSGNLHQVRFLAQELGEAAIRTDGVFVSSPIDALPGVRAIRLAFRGAWQVFQGQAALDTPTGHWYWNASRVIDHVPGEAEPITEFPFFTFVYGDLHAHMMSMPLAMLALTAALAWALPDRPDGGGDRPGLALAWLRRPARLLLAGLAIGALWPTNTWDFPTYGLVAAGAIGVSAWRATRRFDLEWALRVGVVGAVLLGVSLLAFRPYHATNVQPYTDFSAWTGTRTSLANYLEIHGIFLFAVLPWFAFRLIRRLRDPERRERAATRFGVLLALAAGIAGGLWFWSRGLAPLDWPPSPWVPLLVALAVALGLDALLDDTASAGDRLAGWLLVVGAALTGLVEYTVLAGDIGRMNTVFKFYIHVWLLWAVLAAYAAVRLSAEARRSPWLPAWQGAFAVLVLCGLVYPVTAARAKAQDRYPALGDVSAEARATWDDNWQPGLSGIDFLQYAVYEDGTSLHLRFDREAFLWLLQNVDGTPVILEAFRPHYRWGARYSIYTGLPTVLGWDWHQKQQRAGGPPGVVERRASDVDAIYNTLDDAQAWQLLDEHAVELIVVGELERALYSPDGLAKFDAWAESGRIAVRFENEGVVIYGIDRADGSAESAAEGHEAEAGGG